MSNEPTEPELTRSEEPEDVEEHVEELMGPSQDFTSVPEEKDKESRNSSEPETAVVPPEDPTPVVVMKPSHVDRVKDLWYRWWDNKLVRYVTLGVLVLLIAVLVFVRPVQSGLLNLVGVRTSVSVIAIDGSTQQPLKNAHLVVGSADIKTNDEGYAKLTGLRLGTIDIIVRKAGFADSKRTQYIGMRITALGETELKATGTQYTFKLTDYFSAKPVVDMAIASGDATTKSDKTGEALLTIAPSANDVAEAEISASGYRTEKVKLPSDTSKPIAIVLVPSAKEVFVNKESGSYDLYKMDFDGKNKQVLLAATGRETPAIAVLVDPASKRAALVSTRDDVRNTDGYLESALTVVDVATGDSETIEHSENIQLIGWHGTTLVYVTTVAGASAANPNRQKIIAYDYESGKRLQLAGANYFSGTILQGTTVYYIVSSTDPSTSGSFNRVGIDATGKKALVTATLWSMYRQDYSTILLQGASDWYKYKIGGTETTSATPPSTYGSRQYLDSSDGKLSAWVDTRDSTGVLTVYNAASGSDKELTKQRGLSSAVRWVNDTVVVYRVMYQGVMTEYAMSLDGGAPKELTEVSLTY